jgi:O-antigen/teichoic acid export membrane protein
LTRQLFREGVPIGLGQLFWMVKMFGATLIVGAIARPEDVGLFAGAQRILVAAHAFVFLYYFNLLPSLARGWHQAPGVFDGLIRRSLRSMVWLSLLIGVAWVLLAPAAMSLIYGSAFAPGGTTLQWLGGMWLVAAVSGHYRFGLIAAGHQRAEMATSIAGAVVTIALVPLGYVWLGLVGTGIALCAAEVVIWLSAWWLARRKLELPGHLGLLVRPALAGALAVVVGLLAPVSEEIRIVMAGVLLAVLALVFEPELRRQIVDVWGRARRLLANQTAAPVQEVA